MLPNLINFQDFTVEDLEAFISSHIEEISGGEPGEMAPDADVLFAVSMATEVARRLYRAGQKDAANSLMDRLRTMGEEESANNIICSECCHEWVTVVPGAKEHCPIDICGGLGQPLSDEKDAEAV